MIKGTRLQHDLEDFLIGMCSEILCEGNAVDDVRSISGEPSEFLLPGKDEFDGLSSCDHMGGMIREGHDTNRSTFSNELSHQVKKVLMSLVDSIEAPDRKSAWTFWMSGMRKIVENNHGRIVARNEINPRDLS